MYDSHASNCGSRFRTLLTFQVATRTSLLLEVRLDVARLIANHLHRSPQLINGHAELLGSVADFVVLAECDVRAVLAASFALVVRHVYLLLSWPRRRGCDLGSRGHAQWCTKASSARPDP